MIRVDASKARLYDPGMYIHTAYIYMYALGWNIVYNVNPYVAWERRFDIIRKKPIHIRIRSQDVSVSLLEFP